MNKNLCGGLKIKNSKLVEFLVERETIEQHRRSGHTPKVIWRALRESGRISMSYVWFLNLIQKHFPTPSIPQTPSNSRGGAEPTPAKRKEPLMPWTEEKPKREINLCTIGKEYLIERRKDAGSNNEPKK